MKFEQRGTDVYPVDTATGFWLQGEYSLSEILEEAKDRFPNVSIDDINIEAYNHHQYAVHYDLPDSSDYVNYLYISVA